MECHMLCCLYQLVLPFPAQEPPTQGTVTPHSQFSAEADAKTLRTAMKGFGKAVAVYEHGCWSLLEREESLMISYVFVPVPEHAYG